MEGEWKLYYSNGHNDSYTIDANGLVTLGFNGRKAFLQPSNNQAIFPSSQGWFLVKDLFRGQAWEYVRLRGDGRMEVIHFCTDGCGGKYNGLKYYCCTALSPKGEWRLLVQ